MKTIKIPIKLQSDIKDLQRQCSIVIRYAYNRFKEGKNQKEIRLLCKDLKGTQVKRIKFTCQYIYEMEE